MGDFFRIRIPLERHPSSGIFLFLIFRNACGHAGSDRPRANAIDRKPIAAHMQVQTGTGCFMLRALGNPTLNQT